MTYAKLIGGAALALILVAPLVSMEAMAQTQPQGMTVGSPPPPSGGGKPTKASCTKQGKEQGLKGGKLGAFVKTCLKG
jgi:hypothetical protein